MSTTSYAYAILFVIRNFNSSSSALGVVLNWAIALIFHSTLPDIALSKENIDYVQLQNTFYWSSGDRFIFGDWLHTNYSP
ncbi:MAG: hypothetical protein HWQ41_14585 [Nostoc sp. NOS(2021)]|uniref:hypothetical protein n=1 Tax=Nostoc sp. NOS(2021) TaxID=2815407 RepID=UPI0025DFFF76|nr:hypothetical protein [Nostoc sp. NOS(2021)]MBN3896439.1 hypothetical protein [Nostoc sp. NOS(2021)]